MISVPKWPGCLMGQPAVQVPRALCSEGPHIWVLRLFLEWFWLWNFSLEFVFCKWSRMGHRSRGSGRPQPMGGCWSLAPQPPLGSPGPTRCPLRAPARPLLLVLILGGNQGTSAGEWHPAFFCLHWPPVGSWVWAPGGGVSPRGLSLDLICPELAVP